MKKIKLVILIIIVIALPVSGAALLTFAEPADSPWRLAQNLNTENVSGSVWNHFSERPLSEDETAGLVLLLNQLKKADFTEDRSLEGLPPQYGIKLNGDTVYISQTDAPQGNTAMLYHGRQWWIDNDALSLCIYKLCQQQTGASLTSP